MDTPRLDSIEMQNILKNLPGLFQKAGQVDIPPDAAQSLQALAQAGIFPMQGSTQHQLPHQLSVPGLGEPGPSSHPSGPPNLGHSAPPPPQEMSDDQNDTDKEKAKSPGATGSGGRTRSGRNPAMGSDEWARQRKDNHKEVERRRRGNINDGINELGRIVPNSSGEKAKGAILTRAVQYIHHLKENEARNIEKWTLEKLLMDQAMGDLQAQLEEVRRLWEDERMARQRAENELELLRGVAAPGLAQRPAPQGNAIPSSDQPRTRSPDRPEGVREPKEDEEGRLGKRPRTD